jgi:hypothetical protein
MKYYTYIHTRNDTNEPFYVGEGQGNRYKLKRVRNKEWGSITSTVGYTSQILARWNNKEEAVEHEKFLIQVLNEMGYKLTNVAPYGNMAILSQMKDPEFEKKRKEARNSKESLAKHKEAMLKWRFIATNEATGEETIFLGAKDMRNHPMKFDYAKACLCSKGEIARHKKHTWRREAYK